jgi:Flp pilus assembly protein TadB
MIGKLDATMYAINHAEETGRNVRRAAGWLSKHSGSISHGLDTAREAVKSHAPAATPTTSPSAAAAHDAVRSQVGSSVAGTAAAPASPVHAAAVHAVADNPGVIDWFTAAPVGVKAIVVIAAVIVIATAVSLVRRLVRSRRAR